MPIGLRLEPASRSVQSDGCTTLEPKVAVMSWDRETVYVISDVSLRTRKLRSFAYSYNIEVTDIYRK